MSDEDMSDDQESVQRKSYSNLQDLLKDGDGDEEESSEEETQASQDVKEVYYPFTVSLAGQWNKTTSGGTMDDPNWRVNPQFSLRVSESAKVKITLRQRPESFSRGAKDKRIGLYVVRRNGTSVVHHRRLVQFQPANCVAVSPFRENTVMCELELTKCSSDYVIIPVTHSRRHTAMFELTVASTASAKIFEMGDDMRWYENTAKGVLKRSDEYAPLSYSEENHEMSEAKAIPAFSAGGCRHHMTWRNNPQYLVEVKEPTTLVVSLSQSPPAEGETYRNIGFYFAIKKSKGNMRKMTMKNKDIVNKTLFQSIKEVIVELKVRPSANGYRIVPCTFDANELVSYELRVYSKKPMVVKPVREMWDLTIIDSIVQERGTFGPNTSEAPPNQAKPVPTEPGAANVNGSNEDQLIRSASLVEEQQNGTFMVASEVNLKTGAAASAVEAGSDHPTSPVDMPTVAAPKPKLGFTKASLLRKRTKSIDAPEPIEEEKAINQGILSSFGRPGQGNYPHAVFLLKLDVDSVFARKAKKNFPLVVSLLQQVRHRHSESKKLHRWSSGEASTSKIEKDVGLMNIGLHILKVQGRGENMFGAPFYEVTEVARTAMKKAWEISEKIRVEPGEYIIVAGAVSNFVKARDGGQAGAVDRIFEDEKLLIRLGLFSVSKESRGIEKRRLQISRLTDEKLTLVPAVPAAAGTANGKSTETRPCSEIMEEDEDDVGGWSNFEIAGAVLGASIFAYGLYRTLRRKIRK